MKKFIIPAIAVCCCFLWQPVFSQNLIAAYPFNGNANDTSWHNYHGTLFGGATVSNYVLSTGDNITDYLTLPAAILDGLTTFDIIFNVRFNDLHTTGGSATNHILSGDRTALTEAFGLSYQLTVHAWRFAFDANLFDFPDTISNNSWYCVSFSRDSNGTIRLHRDGVQIGPEYTYSTPVNITSLLLGQETDCLGGCFTLHQCTNGEIDNLQVFDDAINPDDITRLCEEITVNTADLDKGFIENLTVYPNPSSRNIYLQPISDPGFTIEVTDVSGRLLFSTKAVSSLDVSPLNAGIYFLIIRNKNGIFLTSRKFLKY